MIGQAERFQVFSRTIDATDTWALLGVFILTSRRCDRSRLLETMSCSVPGAREWAKCHDGDQNPGLGWLDASRGVDRSLRALGWCLLIQ